MPTLKKMLFSFLQRWKNYYKGCKLFGFYKEKLQEIEWKFYAKEKIILLEPV
jgi:hypothetical protein